MAETAGLAHFAGGGRHGMTGQLQRSLVKDRLETPAIYALLALLFVGTLASIVIRIGQALGLIAS